jgi:hypothetical protein
MFHSGTDSKYRKLDVTAITSALWRKHYCGRRFMAVYFLKSLKEKARKFMKSKIIFRMAILVASLMIALTTSAPAQTITPQASGSAEGIYGEYAAATGGKVTFQVQTLEQGPMVQLAGQPFNMLLSTPNFRLETNQVGTLLQNPTFFVPENPGYGQHDMGASVDRFQTIGLPLNLGVYRRLGITAAIGADSRFYESMEFCWPSLSQCKVLDPVAVFLQSKVNNRRRLAAEGWGRRIVYGPPSNPAPAAAAGNGSTIIATSGICGLASNHASKSVSIYDGAYTVTYSDVFGIVLVTKNLGTQYFGLSCDTSCRPQVFAQSHSSSGWGTGGWNVACANTPNSAVGTTGSQGKTIAQTKCTHSWLTSASASVSIANAGSASVSATWSLGGGVDSNGGQIADSCAYF